MARPKGPFAVTIARRDGSPTRTEHDRWNDAFDTARTEVARYRAGTSQAIAITIERWNSAIGAWTVFQNINPKES